MGVDSIVIICLGLDFNVDTALQVVYIHIFFIFQGIFKRAAKKSSLRLIFEAFMKQTGTYLRSKLGLPVMLFVSAMTVCVVIHLNFMLSLDNARLVSTKSTLAYLLAWVFDSSWFNLLLTAAQNIKSQPAALYGLVVFYFYLIQFTLKNVLHQLFVSVVVDGTSYSSSLQEVTCHNRLHF